MKERLFYLFLAYIFYYSIGFFALLSMSPRKISCKHYNCPENQETQLVEYTEFAKQSVFWLRDVNAWPFIVSYSTCNRFEYIIGGDIKVGFCPLE